MIAPGSMASRAAALGLLGAVLGLAYLVAVEPFLDRLRRYEASIAELGHQLGQYARIAAMRTEIEEKIAAFDAQLPLDEELLLGATAALAGADLQDLVKTIVQDHGGRLTSSNTIEPVSEGDLQRIGVEITLETEIAALKAMLYDLEAGRPVLFVDSLRIRGSETPTADGLAGEWDPVVLGVDVSVFGYRRPEAP